MLHNKNALKQVFMLYIVKKIKKTEQNACILNDVELYWQHKDKK